MKNVNVFVDVDLTIVDANGNLIPGARKALQTLKDRDCHLFLWSTAGRDYSQRIAERHGLSRLFEAYLPKPDIVIDDTPSTALNPIVFQVGEVSDLQSIAKQILEKHLG